MAALLAAPGVVVHLLEARPAGSRCTYDLEITSVHQIATTNSRPWGACGAGLGDIIAIGEGVHALRGAPALPETLQRP